MIDWLEAAKFLDELAKLCRAQTPSPAPPPTPEPTPPAPAPPAPVDHGYPPAFLAAIVQLLGPGDEAGGDEGGYSDDPDDPGGETNFGIDARSNPGVDIKNLTKSQAIAMYWQDWWCRYQLGMLPAPIAAKMFNVGVNTGMSQAAKFLQRAVGVPADGIIGPITRAAVAAADPGAVVQSIRDQEIPFYYGLVEKRPSNAKYLDGWLRRAAE